MHSSRQRKITHAELLLLLQIEQMAKTVRDLIRKNQLNEARELLRSKFVTDYKDDITESLFYSFSGFGIINVTIIDEAEFLLCIDLLKEINANFDGYGSNHESALITIIKCTPQIAIIKKLIEVGANVNFSNTDHHTPLHFAVMNLRADIVEILLQSGANLNHVSSDVVEILADYSLDSSLKIIKLLFEAGSLAIKDESFMRLAVKHTNIKAIDLLTSLGVSLYDGIGYDAILTNKVELLIYLLEKHKITLPKDIPYGCELEMFQFCVENNMSLTHYSLSNNTVVLRTSPAAIQCYQRDKNFQFSFDSMHKSFQSSSHLHAMFYTYFDDSCSFIHFAAAYASRQSLAFFISQGLDINKRVSRSGLTALHYATIFDNIEALKILILAGADVDAQDNHGWTALHWAVREENENSAEIAEILLYNGANLEITNHNGKKPSDCIHQYHNGYHSRHSSSAWNDTLSTKKKPEFKSSHLSEDEYDCCLIEVDNKDQINKNTLEIQKMNKRPLLIKINDRYCVYGDKDGTGNWDFNELADLDDRSNLHLSKLSYSNYEPLLLSHHLITPRLKDILKKGHVRNDVPSLSKLTSLFIVNSKECTKNLAYRNELNQDAIKQVENAASDYLTPKKQ